MDIYCVWRGQSDVLFDWCACRDDNDGIILLEHGGVWLNSLWHIYTRGSV